ncbi:hypothetical protein HAX54_031954 [Datura stramonium]|uniref:Uncharacterized protein n=1 Tax=Datura stramonium TaxID=4076 RepID=A0ABS8VAQ7_DATST|nr:hypothetical protein [Datura stramonium]
MEQVVRGNRTLAQCQARRDSCIRALPGMRRQDLLAGEGARCPNVGDWTDAMRSHEDGTSRPRQPYTCAMPRTAQQLHACTARCKAPRFLGRAGARHPNVGAWTHTTRQDSRNDGMRKAASFQRVGRCTTTLDPADS